MPNDQKGAGGAADNLGEGNQNDGQDNQNKEKPSTVTRDAYEKAVSEAKKAKERLAQLESDAKKRTEEELKAKEDYKKLWESTKAEADDWKTKYSGLNSSVQESRKLNAVLGKLPGKVASEYWGLVELDKIAADPETGRVDDASVARYVKEFEQKHARLIDKPQGGKLPGDAAKGAGKELGFEAELRATKTQRELEAVMRKHGKM
jgi:small-conductance mechanosensitive channel